MSPANNIIALLTGSPELSTQITAFYQSVKDSISQDEQISIEQQISNIHNPVSE